MIKIWLGYQHFPRRKILPDDSYAQAWGVSLKSMLANVVDLAFIGQITFSRNFENNWKKNVNFKVILIDKNSFLQMYEMYHNNMSIESWGLIGSSLNP